MRLLFLISGLVTLFLAACSKEEVKPYQNRFIHIMENETSASTVNQHANSVGTYNVYLSSPQFFDTVVVQYKITAGEGLVSGIDYELVQPKTSITFLPGIYDMPIRIKWMDHAIDTSKNNSIQIELLSNNKGIHMGLPGPIKKQTIFTITKTE